MRGSMANHLHFGSHHGVLLEEVRISQSQRGIIAAI